LSYFLKDIIMLTPIMKAAVTGHGNMTTWKWDIRGVFNVSSAYFFLIHPGELHHAGIWEAKMPERVKIFGWLVKFVEKWFKIFFYLENYFGRANFNKTEWL
jgi:hypothetical protein